MRSNNREASAAHSKRACYSLLGTALLFAVQAASTAPALAAQSPSPAVKHGETIFKTRCAVCHTKKPGDTSPFGPPNLYQVFGAKPPALTAEQAEQIIKHGKGQMPAFMGVLTTTDMQDVIEYLRTEGRKKQ